jgi:hypothetical protein
VKFGEINNFCNQVTVSETYNTNTNICPVITVSKYGYWKEVHSRYVLCHKYLNSQPVAL